MRRRRRRSRGADALRPCRDGPLPVARWGGLATGALRMTGLGSDHSRQCGSEGTACRVRLQASTKP